MHQCALLLSMPLIHPNEILACDRFLRFRDAIAALAPRDQLLNRPQFSTAQRPVFVSFRKHFLGLRVRACCDLDSGVDRESTGFDT